MHDFTIFDLGGLVAVAWVAVRVLGPVASAFAKRLEGRPPSPIAEDPAVPQLRAELDQLQERVGLSGVGACVSATAPGHPRIEVLPRISCLSTRLPSGSF